MKKKRRKITIFDFLYYTIGREPWGLRTLALPFLWPTLIIALLFPEKFGIPFIFVVLAVIYLSIDHYFEKRESFVVKHFDKTKYREFRWTTCLYIAWIFFWFGVPLLFLKYVFDPVSFLRNFL